jgi:putative NIF3 family GTP cyclohydrolase 1 type 2
MGKKMLSLRELAEWLARLLRTDRYSPDEQGGIFRASERPVERLGLALEPVADIGEWVRNDELDAVWLHRPWQLPADALPPDVGILAHHLPFDETFTMGYNVALAEALALGPLEEIGYKQAAHPDGPELPRRAIGMIADCRVPRLLGDVAGQIRSGFGGLDDWVADPEKRVNRVAVVGAMTPALVQEAADRGAHLYLTGQYRKAAEAAVLSSGMNVLAVGHHRSEQWGMRAMADVLANQLTVKVKLA